MPEIKTDCYWWLKRNRKNHPSCHCLTSLQCKETGHCNFYETLEEYDARQTKFKEQQLKRVKKAKVYFH